MDRADRGPQVQGSCCRDAEGLLVWMEEILPPPPFGNMVKEDGVLCTWSKDINLAPPHFVLLNVKFKGVWGYSLLSSHLEFRKVVQATTAPEGFSRSGIRCCASSLQAQKNNRSNTGDTRTGPA